MVLSLQLLRDYVRHWEKKLLICTTLESCGNNPSSSTSYQKAGKELMTIDELAVLDGDRCILQLRGVSTFLSYKYDVTQYPLYKETGEYDDRNRLDIEKFVNHGLTAKKGGNIYCDKNAK